jgi:hypothetical protein
VLVQPWKTAIVPVKVGDTKWKYEGPLMTRREREEWEKERKKKDLEGGEGVEGGVEEEEEQKKGGVEEKVVAEERETRGTKLVPGLSRRKKKVLPKRRKRGLSVLHEVEEESGKNYNRAGRSADINIDQNQTQKETQLVQNPRTGTTLGFNKNRTLQNTTSS